MRNLNVHLRSDSIDPLTLFYSINTNTYKFCWAETATKKGITAKASKVLLNYEINGKWPLGEKDMVLVWGFLP